MSRVMSLTVTTVLLAAQFAPAQYIISVDILSPGEADYAGIPPDTLCVDIFGSWGLSDQWTAAGVRGLTSRGAELLYAYNDPNHPDTATLFNVGTANRYRTSLSKPRPRNAPARFSNAGAAAAGAYNPPAASPVATLSEINVAYFASPPETNGPVPSGYVARIALGIANVPNHPAQIDDWHAGLLADAPSDAVFVFRSEPPQGSPWPGTVHATFDHPALYGIDWGVWFVPEPSAALLLLAGAGLARTLRSKAG